MNVDVLEAMIYMAKSRHIAVIDYQKPGEETPTRRWVEPYQLQYTDQSLMVMCWQVNPEVYDRAAWRNFRTDRIRRVLDSGKPYEPRTTISMVEGEMQKFSIGYEPDASASAVKQYSSFVESALLDGRITDDELERAMTMARGLTVDQVRATHARVFFNVLRECLVDGDISVAEEQYLGKVRRALNKLGWAP
jgi:predicted DNA-binding transcriptional regulator YafY